MNILITGGLGFIGNHLVRTLLNQNPTKLIVVDDLSNGDRAYIKEFSNYSCFEFIQHDISKPLPSLGIEIDYVYNLAALVSVPDSFNQPLRTHQVNETGFINVLEFCKAHKVKKLVYASSCAVYGASENFPLSETEVLIPSSPYGLTKLNNEQYARFFHQANGLSSIGLRFFNVYGPGQRANSAYAGVISIFMDKAIHNDPVSIYGDGSQVRDFVYVLDIVEALITASKSNIDLDVFNVGTGIKTSVNDLFKEIKNATGSQINPEFKPQRMGDVHTSISDPSKLEQKLRLKPKTSLSEGIKNLYQSIQS